MALVKILNRVPALVFCAAFLGQLATLSAGDAASGNDPAPDFRLSRLCLYSVTHKTDTITVAVSKRSGAGWSGVCWTHDYSAKVETESWWRRDGDFWKVQGKPIPANSTPNDVLQQHYNIPSADIPVLLDALAKARKKSPMPP